MALILLAAESVVKRLASDDRFEVVGRRCWRICCLWRAWCRLVERQPGFERLIPAPQFFCGFLGVGFWPELLGDVVGVDWCCAGHLSRLAGRSCRAGGRLSTSSLLTPEATDRLFLQIFSAASLPYVAFLLDVWCCGGGWCGFSDRGWWGLGGSWLSS